jgi:mRNA interferase RelE/StbE
MYQLKIKPRAEKELNNLPKKDYRKILFAFTYLAKDPYIGKKMKGKCDGYYTYRVWPYRIIYMILEKEPIVLVIRIGHRQGIYN